MYLSGGDVDQGEGYAWVGKRVSETFLFFLLEF